jgi:thiol-disulfide isomerase/thioredoxin
VTAPAQSTQTGQPSNVTPVPTGTLLPTPAPIVRVTLKATDPSTVRLDAGDAGQLQLVEFFAFWSPLCKSMAPVVHLLEDQYNGRIQFTYLDVDDRANDRFKQALGYQYAPQFFLLDSQGEILKQWKGYVRSEDLVAEFTTLGVAP